MAQIFHPAFNTLSKVSLGVLAVLAVSGLFVLDALQRSPYMTEVAVAREQPVPFSHKHHVQALGIDCRFCHDTVEESSFAGIPSLHTCMTCHAQVWNDSPMLEPIRDAYARGTGIQWNRVHDLPDFAYFDHSIHVAKGMGCTTCHGPVGDMPLMWRHATLHMGWCLDCHRHPEAYIRPREEVFNPTWQAPEDQLTLGRALVAEYAVEPRESCSTCHR